MLQIQSSLDHKYKKNTIILFIVFGFFISLIVIYFVKQFSVFTTISHGHHTITKHNFEVYLIHALNIALITIAGFMLWTIYRNIQKLRNGNLQYNINQYEILQKENHIQKRFQWDSIVPKIYTKQELNSFKFFSFTSLNLLISSNLTINPKVSIASKVLFFNKLITNQIREFG